MTIRALDRVQLVNPVSFGRQFMAMSTIVASPDLHAEGDYHQGRLNDVHVYIAVRQTSDSPLEWQWCGAIPTANIKAYTLVGDLPKPAALPNAEPEAPAQTKATGARAAVTQ
jgi:hypothetical protein